MGEVKLRELHGVTGTSGANRDGNAIVILSSRDTCSSGWSSESSDITRQEL